MEISESHGIDGLQKVYSGLVSGNISPEAGHIFIP
jgi:hypothetical protein